ncbi:MAG: NUDIX hydrolase [Gammaproteobacteria bacterium]|jgi:8-oxo-dGTP diphosphatase
MLTLGHFPPPFVSVNLVIRNGDKVLLIDRRDGLGLGLPGGFLGLKESVEAAAIREVKEETGLDIEITDMLAIFSGRRQGSNIFATNIVYTATITGKKSTRDSLEGKCRWIPLDEIERHEIAIDHIEALKLMRKATA